MYVYYFNNWAWRRQANKYVVGPPPNPDSMELYCAGESAWYVPGTDPEDPLFSL